MDSSRKRESLICLIKDFECRLKLIMLMLLVRTRFKAVYAVSLILLFRNCTRFQFRAIVLSFNSSLAYNASVPSAILFSVIQCLAVLLIHLFLFIIFILVIFLVLCLFLIFIIHLFYTIIVCLLRLGVKFLRL